MIIDDQSIDLVFKGFKTLYTDAFLAAPVHKDKIAMTVPSTGRDETYGWLGQFPQLCEWVGSRHVHNLQAHSFTIANRNFESTVAVKREDISDDKLGIFKPSFSKIGHLARNHPWEMTGREGRTFNLAGPQAVIHAFAQGAIDLPVDYEHQSDKSGKAQNGPISAAGWIKDLKADALGLWGRVEWAVQARELIGAKAYRYISPSFFLRQGQGRDHRAEGRGPCPQSKSATCLAGLFATGPEAWHP